MAAKPSSSSSPGLLKLEEQLTCPVCLDLYTNPKTLPCLHSFCGACIERFPQDKEGETYYLSCPTCHHCAELPEIGAGAFPVAFTLNNLKEIHSLMKKVFDPEHVTCDNCTTANATGYCQDCSKFLCQKCIDIHKGWAPIAHHQIISLDEVTATSVSQLLPAQQQPTLTCSTHGKKMKIYCETCDGVICRDCTVRTHKDHEYDLVSASYTKHCQELEHSLNPVKGKIEALKKILSALAKREGEIRERGEGVLEEIHQMVEEMMNVLRQSERKLSEEAKRVTDAKLEVLSRQAKSAQTSLSLLEHIEDYVEQSMNTGTPQEVLRSKKQMMERMSEVTTQINVEELEPKEKADFVLSKDIKSLHHIGDIIVIRQYKIGKVEHFAKEKKVSFSLSMEAPNSSLVCVPVSSLKCSLVPVGKGDEPIHTTVTTTSTHPGMYRIHCNPSTSGIHTVKVQVYDETLEDTSLVIPFNPYLDNITPVHTITELNHPWGVAVSDEGHVIVTERNGHCITILDNEGKKLKLLGGEEGRGNVKFLSPRGVAITPDNFILVSDDHRIQKISMDGDCIASVGEEGSGPLQFKSPAGIAISPLTGDVYIADWNNHCIQVLNLDLTFSHSFGSEGSANGQFHNPCDIAIDKLGLVYITDVNSHRIQIFSPDGKFVAQFGSHGYVFGQLRYPRGITIDTAGTGLVYVSEEGNHRVSVFTGDGVFVTSLGMQGNNIDEFNTPRGVIFGKEGLLYVCDYSNKRLVTY